MDYRSVLSKHRTAIMGLMSILIMFFHAKLPVPISLYNYAINQGGAVGVDVFFFLSGFGLAHALEKSNGFADYMGRRLQRILPSYYAFVLLYIIYTLIRWKCLPNALLALLVPIGGWLNNGFFYWYVSAILGYYVIAALFYPLMRRSKYLVLTTALLLVLVGWYVPSVSRMDNSIRDVVRVPGLVVGLAVGCADMREEPRYRRGWLGIAGIALVFLCGIAMFVFWTPLQASLFPHFNYEKYWRVALSLCAPFVAVVTAYGLEGCNRAGLGFVHRILAFLGSYTLEFYLCHIALLFFASYIFPSPYIRLPVAFLLSIPFSIATKWIGRKLYKLWMLLISRLSLEK